MSYSESIAVRVNLGPRSYQIPIVSHQLVQSGKSLTNWWLERDGMSSIACTLPPPSGSLWLQNKKHPVAGTALIVTDSNVATTYAATVKQSLVDCGWICETAVFPAGESSKSFDVVSGIYDQLIGMNADRRTLIVAVGGGVVGDAAGFVAATYTRGLPFAQVPTSLLAAVDSSVGGKTGINHPLAKNMIGAFYQPIGVFIDTAVFETLSDREYRSGLAEVVKYGVILDPEFFTYLEQNIAAIQTRQPEILRQVITRCCRLKADVVERDEFETTGLRAMLNYGHTFGHAFETLSGYGHLLHGEAVAIGMICASRLAERRGLIDTEVTNRQSRLLQAFQLPTSLPLSKSFTTDDVLNRMKLDKKTVSGSLRFVLPTRLGEVQIFADISLDDVRAVLN